jgi:hypothetical protein
MSKFIEGAPTKGEFAQAVNSTFRAHVDKDRLLDLCLVEFDDSASTEVQECFSLLFRAPVDAPPVQSIYRLTNETLGAMDLFLVPVRKDDGGLYYEAVFNRFLNQ